MVQPQGVDLLLASTCAELTVLLSTAFAGHVGSRGVTDWPVLEGG
jgi:hypothetical protein